MADLDNLRAEIGDIDGVLYTDDQLTYFLSSANSNVLLAAANACDALATRFAAGIDFTTDSLSVKKFQRAEMMSKQADKLRQRNEGISELVTTPIDGYSQDLDALDTNQLPLNIDPDIPRYGPAWDTTLARQSGDTYVPPAT